MLSEIMMDENQMHEHSLTGRPGKWVVYFRGSLSGECQDGLPATAEARRVRSIRDMAASLANNGRVALSQRSTLMPGFGKDGGEGKATEYLMARK